MSGPPGDLRGSTRAIVVEEKVGEKQAASHHVDGVCADGDSEAHEDGSETEAEGHQHHYRLHVIHV